MDTNAQTSLPQNVHNRITKLAADQFGGGTNIESAHSSYTTQCRDLFSELSPKDWTQQQFLSACETIWNQVKSEQSARPQGQSAPAHANR